ncbi:MAG: molybdenum cofactor guanylyltransferase [Myxococcales bacterium]|jgi:molybdopterin-guanine dinucleotide biosynthesis protein A
MVDEAAAAILAGGDGTRLGGARKALLELEGRPFIARQLEVLRALFAEVFVVANDPAPFAPFGVPVVADLLVGKGAPGAVYTAVISARAPWVFCVGCDMPFLEREAIELLAARRRGEAAAVAPFRRGRPEPLFTFYSRRCAEPFGRLLRAGEPSLIGLLSQVEVEQVGEAELGAHRSRLFENVNTPEDLARLLAGRLSKPEGQ